MRINENTKKALIRNGIAISANIIIAIFICGLFEGIEQQLVVTSLKVLVHGVFGIINTIIIFFTLLYWWSENRWDDCKYKWRKFKRKFQ